MKTTKIFGPPGTGKTTSLIKILTGYLESGYHPSQISYLSFTNAAVEETKQRIAQQFTSFDLQKDFKNFRTVHSACCLKAGIARHEIMASSDYAKFSQETGFRIKARKDQSFQELSGLQSYGRVLDAKSYAAHKKVPMHEALSHMSIKLPRSRVDYFLTEYAAFKEREGKYDFDDMLKECLGKGSIGTPIILVDECQDLSDLQLDIIKEWAVGCENLYLAGDDDQSIYAFNGASEYGFLDFPADETEVLRQSYRVPLAIGLRAERVIRKVTKRQPKIIEWTSNESHIEHIKTWSILPYRDAFLNERNVMILCRHRNQVTEVRQTLERLKIPCTIDGKMPWKKSKAKQVKNFYHLLDGGKLNASDMTSLLRAMGQKFEAAKIRKLVSVQKEFGLGDVGPLSWKDLPGTGFMRKMISKYGIEILDKPITIDVSTFHSSKGREADAVVILTDCYDKVIENLRIAPDTERRLCYVALTRTKHKLFISRPETDKYLKPLLEA